MRKLSGIDSRGRDWVAIGLWFVLAVLVAFLLFSAGWWMARETHDVGKTGSYAHLSCTEDEYTEDHDGFRVRVHVEGDGWRVVR